MEIRKLYDSMKADGDLFEMVEGTTGKWSEDKAIFIEYYNQVNNFLNDFEVEEFN